MPSKKPTEKISVRRSPKRKRNYSAPNSFNLCPLFIVLSLTIPLMNEEYVQELETEWRASLPTFSPQFLYETFPDAWQDIIPAKIKELQGDRQDLCSKINQTLKGTQATDAVTQMLVRECVKYFWIPDLFELERHISRLKRLLIIQEVGSKNMRRYIDLAKQNPILDVATRNGLTHRRSGKSYAARCPFHDDHSPSLHLYPESNSFYCFGCQKGGDVIHFVQDLLHLTFVEAVRYLTLA